MMWAVVWLEQQDSSRLGVGVVVETRKVIPYSHM